MTKQVSETLGADVAAFLAAGGSITACPSRKAGERRIRARTGGKAKVTENPKEKEYRAYVLDLKFEYSVKMTVDKKHSRRAANRAKLNTNRAV